MAGRAAMMQRMPIMMRPAGTVNNEVRRPNWSPSRPVRYGSVLPPRRAMTKATLKAVPVSSL